MTWQKIVQHISDQRIIVESKSGNQYPVETEYDRYGKDLYSQLTNRAHDGKTYWAWVNFDDGKGPVLEDWKISEEYPTDTPMDH